MSGGSGADISREPPEREAGLIGQAIGRALEDVASQLPKSARDAVRLALAKRLRKLAGDRDPLELPVGD